MTDFQTAWAVVLRDLSPVEGDEADVVTVLRVFWTHADALREVERLRATDEDEDRLYYCEVTEVARASFSARTS
jgi:hypothetical protein